MLIACVRRPACAIGHVGVSLAPGTNTRYNALLSGLRFCAHVYTLSAVFGRY